VKDLQCFAAGTTGKALVLALVLGLPVACSTRKQQLTHHVVVADISGRIEPASRHEMLEGIAAFAVTLRRGDKLTVIPITGDAEADSQGRILQFAVPTRSEPYDEDLRRFGAQVRERMVQLTSEAERAPGDHTDILGTLDIVADEIRSSLQVSCWTLRFSVTSFKTAADSTSTLTPGLAAKAEPRPWLTRNVSSTCPGRQP
jgi:hypothetical protein